MSLSSGDQLRPEVRAWLESELDAEKLIANAQTTTGLTDGLDTEFRDALRTLVGCFKSEAKLSDAGLFGVRDLLRRVITERLKIERDLAIHPEISAVSVERPIFIVGLPRTGTTLLHNLMAQDPSSRCPALWELMRPSPPPEPASRANDPRIALADAYVARLLREAPSLQELHPMASTAPDECNWLLLHSLRVGRLRFEYDIPSYTKFLTPENMLCAYKLHRTLVQLLTWRCESARLVLKDPFHLWCLGTLFEIYPDARVIHMHRHPGNVLPSAVKLCAVVRSVSSNIIDLREVAGRWVDHFREGLEYALSVRAMRPASFHDVRFADLVRDPVAAARRIYDVFEMEWSHEIEARMREWLARSGHSNRRPSRYDDLAGLGLNGAAVMARYAPYCERFQLREG